MIAYQFDIRDQLVLVNIYIKLLVSCPCVATGHIIREILFWKKSFNKINNYSKIEGHDLWIELYDFVFFLCSLIIIWWCDDFVF